MSKLKREDNLLIHLAEECAEVTQRVSKILRFGINEFKEGNPGTNREMLRSEVIDLLEVINVLIDEKIIDPPTNGELQKKRDKIQKYFEYSVRMGLIEGR